MGKNKLLYFEQIKTFENVIEEEYKEFIDHPIKGKWLDQFFKNKQPIILELGCGKGHYTIALAKANPHINYIGVDLKGDRIHRGAKLAMDSNLTNVAFLRVEIEKLELYFAPNEVSEIWITFPDPQLRTSKEKKRLTSKRFINVYKNISITNSFVHLKTDSEDLYDYTLKKITELDLVLIENYNSIYSETNLDQNITSIKTYYEQKFLKRGIAIKYIKFQLT